jgi:uncharacterized protein YjiS (DUF1127 family)
MNLSFQGMSRRRAVGRAAGALWRLRRRLGLALAVGSLRLSDIAQQWRERARQRRALQNLNDELLKDIGLSRCDVEGESSKWFWRQ